MKILLTIVPIAFLISGCNPDYRMAESKQGESNFGGKRIRSKECEYVVWTSFNGVAMVHAGDCDNRVHLNK